MQIYWSLTLSLAVTGAALAPAGAAPRTHSGKDARPLVSRMVRLNARDDKPAAPVAIAVVPGRVTAAGRQEVLVTATPGVRARQLILSVRAGDGLVVASRHADHTARGEAKVPVTRAVELAASGPGQRRVTVTATLVFANGARQTGIAAYLLNPQAPRVRPSSAGSRRVDTPDGRQILELPSGNP